MALGHLLAVTTKLALGTFDGPVPLFYAIGIALAPLHQPFKQSILTAFA